MAGRSASHRALEVFVSRIPWTVAKNEIKDYFAQFGTVRRCSLPFDKETGFHRGLCWIEFSTNESINNVLQKDTHIMEGAKLIVRRNEQPNRRIADNN